MSTGGMIASFAAGVVVGLALHAVIERTREQRAAAATAAAEAAATVETAPAAGRVVLHRANEPERFSWEPIRSTVRQSGVLALAVLRLALATLRAVAGEVLAPREIRPVPLSLPVAVEMPRSMRAPRVDLWSRCCRSARPVRGPDRAGFFTLDTRSFPEVHALI